MRFFPILAIFVLELLLILANVTPGTFLLGWDSLNPELNFPLNVQRSLFAVWQEYRGLGLLDGMAHAANLPHTIIIWMLHFILPTSLLRYTFILLMHLLGAIGMYVLLQQMTKQRIGASLGAIFYQLNLATIQMFYTPFEVFAVHFAGLPWLMFFLLRYLRRSSRKNLLMFFALSVLTLPQAFIPQVFFVFFSLVCLILLTHLLRYRRHALKAVLSILFVLFTVNATWLLPFAYQLPKNAPIIMHAKINQMSSEEVYLRNKARGGLFDVLSLKGFMLDVTEFNREGKDAFIMEAWRQHSSSRFFLLFSLGLFGLAFIGTLVAVKHSQWDLLPFLVMMLVAFIVLGSAIPGISILNDTVRQNIPILGETLRFSFTKFSIIFVFCLSIFFSVGIAWAIVRLRSISRSKVVIWIFTGVVSGIIVYNALPAFYGFFFFPAVRLSIPQAYKDAITFFRGQDPNARIAPFPQHTFWSWRYTDWGYRGSGFLWQALPQSMMDRAFDPWSKENEQYYQEISYALYANNPEQFERVLEKYQVDWILLDRSIIYPPSPDSLYQDKLMALLDKLENIQRIRKFDTIDIYAVDRNTPDQALVFLTTNPIVVESPSFSQIDQAFRDYGVYRSADQDGWSDITYPFQNNIEDSWDGAGSFRISLPSKFQPSTLWSTPASFREAHTISPELHIRENSIDILLHPVNNQFSASLRPNDPLKKRQSFYLPNLPHDLGYIISINYRTIAGSQSIFWIENLQSKRPDIEIKLPLAMDWSVFRIIQPPMDPHGAGYTIHIDSRTIGDVPSLIELSSVEINPIPFAYLSTLRLAKDNAAIDHQTETHQPISVWHQIPSLYAVSLPILEPKSYLVLGQSFADGWILFDFSSGRKVQRAGARINGWANGWRMSDRGGRTIYLVYAPQLLQFLGIFLLVGTGLILLIPQIPHARRVAQKDEEVAD